MARNTVARPCPPPSATTEGPPVTRWSVTRGSATVDVAVVDVRRHAVRFQPARELGGDDHTAVPSTSAPDADREVRLAFAHVGGKQQREQALELLEEGGGLRLRKHVVAHALIRAVEGSE